jgi:hypothetical protein
MTRRANRRRRDLQRQLLLGPAVLRDLARAVRRPRVLVWADLTALEETGAVVSEWQACDGWPAGAWAYRLPTIAEQDALAICQAAFEARVSDALHAAADPIGDDDRD